MSSARVFMPVAALACVLTAVALPPDADANPSPGPTVSPTSTSSPTFDAANDPCGGPGRLLATLNRPTVGYSVCAVPNGAVVLEDGYQNQTQATPPQASVAYPVGFQRFGVADRFEVDLIGPNVNRVRGNGVTTTGSSDLGLGFKAELPPRGRFTYAIDGLFTAATGTNGFGAGGPGETLDVDVAYAVSSAVGFATTIAGASAAQGGERFGYLLPSVVVTVQTPNSYQFYAELVGQTKLGPQPGGRVFSDFGVQKLLGRNVEVDTEYATSFTPVGGSRFHYFGIGAGVRLK